MEDNTFPKLLKVNYHKYANSRVAMRQKKLGIWQSYTWEDFYLHVKRISLGLVSIGLKQGQTVLLIGDNCPEFYWIELAIHCANATSVMAFAESNTREIADIINDAEVTFALVQDQQLVSKIMEEREAIPRIKKIIYWEGDDLMLRGDPFFLSLYDLEGIGHEYEGIHPDLFEQNIVNSNAGDICILSYTSNNTGSSLGTIVTYDDILKTMREFLKIETWYSDDEYFSFMPIASFWEQNLGIAGSLLTGNKINFPASAYTVQRDICEISPHIIQYPSSIWQKLFTSVTNRMNSSHVLNKTLFNFLIPGRIRISKLKATGQNLGIFDRVLWAIGHAILFKQLLNKLGFGRNRLAYTDGGSINHEAFDFLRALGINVKHLFGTTETQINTVHREGDVRPETLGTAIPDCAVGISEGEILVRGVRPFGGYFRGRKKKDNRIDRVSPDGWFYTHRRGFITEENWLVHIEEVEKKDE